MIVNAVAKLFGGIAASRAHRRAAANAATAINMQNNFIKSNLYSDAIGGYGHSLLASAHSGGFDPQAFNGGFSDLAADLRTAQFNAQQRIFESSAQKSAARTSLIMSGLDAAMGHYWEHRDYKKDKRNYRKMQSLLTIENSEGL
jgi:hypothetical protein